MKMVAWTIAAMIPLLVATSASAQEPNVEFYQAVSRADWAFIGQLDEIIPRFQIEDDFLVGHRDDVTNVREYNITIESVVFGEGDADPEGGFLRWDSAPPLPFGLPYDPSEDPQTGGGLQPPDLQEGERYLFLISLEANPLTQQIAFIEFAGDPEMAEAALQWRRELELNDGSCVTDADCVLTTFVDCCDCCECGEVWVTSVQTLRANEEECAIEECPGCEDVACDCDFQENPPTRAFCDAQGVCDAE